jgi:hypothetical protein
MFRVYNAYPQGKSGVVGQRFEEAKKINTSLSSLRRVIEALGADDRGVGSAPSFVPYRDSTLTWLLKDSLGGNSKTLMVATLSPALDNASETLSTLRCVLSSVSISDCLCGHGQVLAV